MEMSPELAEFCGLHVGDGYLRYLGKSKDFDISGNVEEKDFYDGHVVPLVNHIFGLEIKARYFPSRRTYGFRTSNKKVIDTMKQIGFPSGAKSLIISVPKIILESTDKDTLRKFLRGYFDTDGCLNFYMRRGKYCEFKRTRHIYPRLTFNTVSEVLNHQIVYLLRKLGFVVCSYTHRSKYVNESLRYIMRMNGEKQLIKWMKEVGIKNSVKNTRYSMWEKFGFCPPNTSLKLREKVLKGEIDPNSLYGPVA